MEVTIRCSCGRQHVSEEESFVIDCFCGTRFVKLTAMRLEAPSATPLPEIDTPPPSVRRFQRLLDRCFGQDVSIDYPNRPCDPVEADPTLPFAGPQIRGPSEADIVADDRGEPPPMRSGEKIWALLDEARRKRERE